MKNVVLKSSILLICLALTPASFAKGKGKGHKAKGGMDGIFKQLDLSKEQKEQLKEIRKSKKNDMKSLKEAKMEAKKNFHSGLESGKSDSALKSLHKKMVSAEENFRNAKLDNMLKTRSILTAEQKKKFQSLKSEMKGKRKGRKK